MNDARFSELFQPDPAEAKLTKTMQSKLHRLRAALAAVLGEVEVARMRADPDSTDTVIQPNPMGPFVGLPKGCKVLFKHGPGPTSFATTASVWAYQYRDGTTYLEVSAMDMVVMPHASNRITIKWGRNSGR